MAAMTKRGISVEDHQNIIFIKLVPVVSKERDLKFQPIRNNNCQFRPRLIFCWIVENLASIIPANCGSIGSVFISFGQSKPRIEDVLSIEDLIDIIHAKFDSKYSSAVSR